MAKRKLTIGRSEYLERAPDAELHSLLTAIAFGARHIPSGPTSIVLDQWLNGARKTTEPLALVSLCKELLPDPLSDQGSAEKTYAVWREATGWKDSKNQRIVRLAVLEILKLLARCGQKGAEGLAQSIYRERLDRK